MKTDWMVDSIVKITVKVPTKNTSLSDSHPSLLQIEVCDILCLVESSALARLNGVRKSIISDSDKNYVSLFLMTGIS